MTTSEKPEMRHNDKVYSYTPLPVIPYLFARARGVWPKLGGHPKATQ